MKTVKALLLGDLIGQSGCRAVFFKLGALVKRTEADLVVVNAENAAEGFGLWPEQADQLWQAGVDVITTGNHIWQKKEIYPYLDSQPRLLRPANYPKILPGHGSCLIEKAGVLIAVLNFQGRRQMADIDDPFTQSEELVARIRKQTPVILVDFHAEATEEKEAFGFHLDGQVSVVVGTHTHIPTADERLLPQGTAYVSDLGMCGPALSVIGSDPKIAIEKALSQLPLKSEVLESPSDLWGVLVVLDAHTGRALSIERIHEPATL